MKRYGWEKRLQPEKDNHNKTVTSQSPSMSPSSQYQQGQNDSKKQSHSPSHPFNNSEHLKNAGQTSEKMSRIKNISEISPHVFFQGMDSLGENKQRKQNYSRASSRPSSSNTPVRSTRNRVQEIENERLDEVGTDAKQIKQISSNSVPTKDQALKMTDMKLTLDKIDLESTGSVSLTERRKQQAEKNDMKSGSKTERTVLLASSDGSNDRMNGQVKKQGSLKSKTIVEKQQRQKQQFQVTKRIKRSNFICLNLKKYFQKQFGAVFFNLAKHKERFDSRMKKYSIVLKKLNSKLFYQDQQSCLKFFKLLTLKISTKESSKYFESVKGAYPKIVHILYKRLLRSAFNKMKHKGKRNSLPLSNALLRYFQTTKLQAFKNMRNFSSVNKNSKQLSAISFLFFYKTKLHSLLSMSLRRILGARGRTDQEQITSIAQVEHPSYLSPVRQRGTKRSDEQLLFSQSKKKLQNFDRPMNRKTTLAQDTIGLRLEKQVKEQDKHFEREKNNMEFRVEELKQIISEYNFQLSFKQKAEEELRVIVKSLDSGEELKKEILVKQQNKKCELSQIYFKIDKMPDDIEVDALKGLIKVHDPNGQIEKLVQLWTEVMKGRQLHRKIKIFENNFESRSQSEVEVNKEGSAKKFAVKQEKILKELFYSYAKEQYLWNHVAVLAKGYL